MRLWTDVPLGPLERGSAAVRLLKGKHLCIPSTDRRSHGDVKQNTHLHVSQNSGEKWERLGSATPICSVCLLQQSTLKSPFFLLYRRDPRLPTDSVMSPAIVKKLVNLKEYGTELVSSMLWS